MISREFDDLDGYEFEVFCSNLLKKNGYQHVSITAGSGDQGIDIIAFRDGVKYGIQCKRYSSDIGNHAVMEAHAGKTFYDCQVGVVLTNRYFTDAAKELAQKNGIVLWDRYSLMKLIKGAVISDIRDGISVDYVRDCVKDELGWIERRETLGDKLKFFWEATGIQPFIYMKRYDMNLLHSYQKEKWATDYFDLFINQDNAFLFVYFAEKNSESSVGYMAYAIGEKAELVLNNETIDTFWQILDHYWYTWDADDTDGMFVQVFKELLRKIN